MATIGAKIINAHLIEQALLDAFEEWTREDVNKTFWESEFRRTDWPYNREEKTIRQNPAAFIPEAGNPRDIYDYGELMESGMKSYDYDSGNDGAAASWHWDAKNNKGEEYAWYVHEGTRFMPGRPFTDRISDAKFSLRLPVGRALLAKMRTSLNKLNAN